MGAVSRQVRKQMERHQRLVASCRRSGSDHRVQRLLHRIVLFSGSLFLLAPAGLWSAGFAFFKRTP